MPIYDFTNRTALVTGGTRGIGAAISRAFLNAGARVIATYAKNDSAAAEFRSALTSGADRLEIAKLDSSDYDAVELFFKPFIDGDRDLDIIVNNAGIRKDNALAMMPREDWGQVIDINLSGVYNVCKFGVMAMMRKRYGRIINLSSPGGDIGFAGQSNYAASKAGIVALTKSLSKETAKRNITANCVSPGFIETDLLDGLSGAQADEYRKSVPLKRFGTPDEVANGVLFLADAAASYITGSTLTIAGGL
jgi:3-oxoacyl-[acyl-carrier protein] reductase